MAEIVRTHRVARLSRYRVQAKRRLSIGFALLLVGAFLAASVLGSLALRYAMPQLQLATREAKGPEIVLVTLPLCQGGQGRDCVIDGDTFRLGGQSIRIADIDTPETRDFGCVAEKALGDRATARMQQLLNAGSKPVPAPMVETPPPAPAVPPPVFISEPVVQPIP
jgi:endonuclease YncB( thermonuclease family)